ncbi:hypothetical protein B0I37DRAFT_215511 [Chaetomium sp. MPI-CAGE-AT-0009]|nr:hypothetical protein B0I37DRAFT_215511 [Chaetomium sp. MPI-CAGE-AT-0009]
MSREQSVFHSKNTIVKVNGEVLAAGQNQENRGLGGLTEKSLVGHGGRATGQSRGPRARPGGAPAKLILGQACRAPAQRCCGFWGFSYRAVRANLRQRDLDTDLPNLPKMTKLPTASRTCIGSRVAKDHAQDDSRRSKRTSVKFGEECGGPRWARGVDPGQRRHCHLLHLGTWTCQTPGRLGHTHWIYFWASVLHSKRVFPGCVTSSLSRASPCFPWMLPFHFPIPRIYLPLRLTDACAALACRIHNPEAGVETEKAISFLVPFSCPSD